MTLISIAGKIFAHVLLNRLIPTIAQENTAESQGGFRSNRGTVDMIFVLRQIQEKCREQNIGLYAVFVDLTKAFYTVSRDGLWKILARLGGPPKFLTNLCQLHKGQRGQVKHNGSRRQAGMRSSWSPYCSPSSSPSCSVRQKRTCQTSSTSVSEQTAVSSTFGVSDRDSWRSSKGKASCEIEADIKSQRKTAGDRKSEQHLYHPRPKPSSVQSAVGSAHQESASTATSEHSTIDHQPSQQSSSTRK